ncbi:MAG TPA: DUF6081 family protein [Alphaproteobacteria bacterium]
MKELIEPSPAHRISRRQLMSGTAGLGLSTIAAKVAAQSPASPVVRPTPGKTMIYDDFSSGAWPSPRWLKFRSADYDLWDPETQVRCPGPPENTLTIDLPRFTISHPNHVKALMLSTTAFDLEDSAGFTVQVEMAVRTFGTERNTFGLDPGDPRLANGALVVIDPDTGMVFDFFVSNDRIRPLYERLPSARKQLGPYPAYSILVDAVPTQTGEWHLYEVRYDRAADRVEWRVDRKLIAAQDRVGAPVGMEGPIVKLRRPRIGGGLFTLLDDLANDRTTADDNPRVAGLVRSNWDDRFGQGGQVTFRKFTVEG